MSKKQNTTAAKIEYLLNLKRSGKISPYESEVLERLLTGKPASKHGENKAENNDNSWRQSGFLD